MHTLQSGAMSGKPDEILQAMVRTHEDNKRLSALVKESEKQIAVLLQQLEAQRHEYIAELNEANKKTSALQGAYEQLQKENEVLRAVTEAKLQAKNDKIAELHAQIETLHISIRYCQLEIKAGEDNENRIEVLDEQVEKLNTKIEELETHKLSLEMQVAELEPIEASNKAFEKKIKQQEATVQQYQSQCDTLQSKLAELTEDMAKLKKENDAQKASIRKLTKKLAVECDKSCLQAECLSVYDATMHEHKDAVSKQLSGMRLRQVMLSCAQDLRQRSTKLCVRNWQQHVHLHLLKCKQAAATQDNALSRQVECLETQVRHLTNHNQQLLAANENMRTEVQQMFYRVNGIANVSQFGTW